MVPIEREIITLEGKSLKGKNRVREHGSEWMVIQTIHNVRPNDILIAPVNGDDLRWISRTNDKHFIITASKIVPAFGK